MPINALTSLDKDHLLVGMIHYYVGMLKFDHTTQQYSYYRQVRLEKAHNIEGQICDLQRV